MRKIAVLEWKEKDKEGNEHATSTLNLLEIVLLNPKPENFPRGVDKFRTFRRLDQAFEKAKETKILVLEEADYSVLKGILENNMPASWAFNKDLYAAVDSFLEAKEEKA